MLIPVHLDGQASPLLVVLDGPSLCVRRAGTADLRLPLRRLGRISVRGAVTFAAAVLPACLQAGVPVSFLDGRGQALGQLVPSHSRRGDLGSLLGEVIERGQAAAIRERWRAVVIREAVARTMLALGLRLEAPRPELVHRAAARAIDAVGAPLPTEEIYARLFALGVGLVAEMLLAEGAGAAYQGADTGWDLGADLREVLAFDLWPLTRNVAAYLARHGIGCGDGRSLQERIVRQFEGARPQLALRLADAGLALRRALREVLA